MLLTAQCNDGLENGLSYVRRYNNNSAVAYSVDLDNATCYSHVNIFCIWQTFDVSALLVVLGC